MSDEPSALSDQLQLLVDFPARRPTTTVRFDSRPTVYPVRSTLTMIRHKEELWYSKWDVLTMRTQMRLDAATLRRSLLAHSTEDHQVEDVHVSQVVGLEKALDPTQAESK